MKEQKCWIDGNGTPHLKKNDCIKIDMEKFIRNIGIGKAPTCASIAELIINNKDIFLDFLVAYGDKKAIPGPLRVRATNEPEVW